MTSSCATVWSYKQMLKHGLYWTGCTVCFVKRDYVANLGQWAFSLDIGVLERKKFSSGYPLPSLSYACESQWVCSYWFFIDFHKKPVILAARMKANFCEFPSQESTSLDTLGYPDLPHQLQGLIFLRHMPWHRNRFPRLKGEFHVVAHICRASYCRSNRWKGILQILPSSVVYVRSSGKEFGSLCVSYNVNG